MTHGNNNLSINVFGATWDLFAENIYISKPKTYSRFLQHKTINLLNCTNGIPQPKIFKAVQLDFTI